MLAILVGTAVRTAWTPGRRWTGAAGRHRRRGRAGHRLLLRHRRLLGLPHRIATLVACGNSICGNSAIAAVAPIIGADGEDVAASIAFTAVLGVVVVLTLPLTVKLLHLSGL